MRREQEAVDQPSEAQRRLVQALRDPACYPHPVGSISIIETHISFIVLTGTFAYKIKKSVDLGFLSIASNSTRTCAGSIVMNEVAFLVMDLHAANRPDLARRFLNTYLEFSGDYGGLRLGVRFGAVLSKRAMNCTPKFRQGHRFFQSRAKTSHIASQVHPC